MLTYIGLDKKNGKVLLVDNTTLNLNAVTKEQFVNAIQNQQVINVGLKDGKIVGTNGSLNNYGVLGEKNVPVVIKVGTKRNSKRGRDEAYEYIISDIRGKTVKYSREQSVVLFKKQGVANARVVEKEGIVPYISAIRGKFDVYSCDEYKGKVDSKKNNIVQDGINIINDLDALKGFYKCLSKRLEGVKNIDSINLCDGYIDISTEPVSNRYSPSNKIYLNISNGLIHGVFINTKIKFQDMDTGYFSRSKDYDRVRRDSEFYTKDIISKKSRSISIQGGIETECRIDNYNETSDVFMFSRKHELCFKHPIPCTKDNIINIANSIYLGYIDTNNSYYDESTLVKNINYNLYNTNKKATILNTLDSKKYLNSVLNSEGVSKKGVDIKMDNLDLVIDKSNPWKYKGGDSKLRYELNLDTQGGYIVAIKLYCDTLVDEYSSSVFVCYSDYGVYIDKKSRYYKEDIAELKKCGITVKDSTAYELRPWTHIYLDYICLSSRDEDYVNLYFRDDIDLILNKPLLCTKANLNKIASIFSDL